MSLQTLHATIEAKDVLMRATEAALKDANWLLSDARRRLREAGLSARPDPVEYARFTEGSRATEEEVQAAAETYRRAWAMVDSGGKLP